jgi:hypothetical protein
VAVIIWAHLRSSAPHLPDLATAKRELARQGRGTSLRVVPRDIDIPIARADADLTEGDMNVAQDDRPDSWKFKLVSHALINAKTPEEWHASLEQRTGQDETIGERPTSSRDSRRHADRVRRTRVTKIRSWPLYKTNIRSL